MKLIEQVHGSYVHGRRVRVLCQRLSALLPPNATVLDVGCGDGLLARLIADTRPDVTIEGIDVLVRGQTHVPVRPFDGRQIPHPDQSFDVVMFVDVLHHTDDPHVLLHEAARVSKKHLLIKDHTRNGLLARPTLRFMDQIGNARYGVALPYNYWSREQWQQAFSQLRLRVGAWEKNLGLYPWPASLVFGRSLHFIARLDKSA